MDKSKKIATFIAFFFLGGFVLAWMITEASRGTEAGYHGRLYIVDSDVQVRLYVLKDGTYQLQSNIETDPLIEIDLLEPGKNQKYRFDIINNNDVPAAVRINFADITGDLEELKDNLIFASSNPEVFSFTLSDRLDYEEDSDVYFFKFYDEVRIDANSTKQVFWSAEVNKDAGNEIENKSLLIDKVVFTKPN